MPIVAPQLKPCKLADGKVDASVDTASLQCRLGERRVGALNTRQIVRTHGKRDQQRARSPGVLTLPSAVYFACG